MQQWVKFVPQCHQLFLKIGLSSVRKMYVVGALLRNAPNAPKKSVKIQHILHLRVPIVESQKW